MADRPWRRRLVRIAKWVSIVGAVLGVLRYVVWRPLPSFVEVPEERSRLIADLVSYQTVAQVTAALQAAGYTWQTEESEWSETERSKPRLEFTKVVVENFVHLECAGKLVLEFSNDRLANAAFYPPDFQRYLQHLAQAEGFTFEFTKRSFDSPQGELYQELFLPPHTRIFVLLGYNRLRLPARVIWREERLDWEWQLWYATYGTN